MQHTKVIVSMLLVCSTLLYGDEFYRIVFGHSIPQPSVQQRKAQADNDVCPIDPPLGADVFVVIVDGVRFRRLGLWSRMSAYSKQEARKYIASGGKVDEALSDHMQLLVCGTDEVDDPRVVELKARVATKA